MLRKAMKPCPHPGCPELTTGGPCPTHAKLRQRQRDDQRGTSADRLYDHRWRAAREAFLREHLWCEECLKRGVYEPATVVDHRIPHRGDLNLFWDRSNWAPLCATDHNIKTASEDGGFGNTVKR